MPSEPVKLTQAEIIALARREGALPETVEVGDVFKRVPMLMSDGKRWHITTHSHTRIRITAVPGGRRTRFSYVKVDAKAMGNGRADRGEHRCDLLALARHYSLVSGREALAASQEKA